MSVKDESKRGAISAADNSCIGLERALAKMGLESVRLGNKVLISPFGGRILGLYPQPDLNVFWLNQALLSSTSGPSFVEGPDWVNMGGDRTWISPEMETNVNDPARVMETFVVQKSIDPGDYLVKASDDSSITLENTAAIDFWRSGETVPLKITKTVSLLDNPFPCTGKALSFAGYSLDLNIETDARLEKARPALWHIIQVPGGGKIVLPVNNGANPRAFRGKPVYEQSSDRISCQVKADASFKLSLRAEDSRGFMLYLNTTKAPSFMVACSFSVGNNTDYMDSHPVDPTDTGYVQQIYVDDGALGGFGEMEHHTSALGQGHGHSRISESCRVWAYCGTEKQLQVLADEMIAERTVKGSVLSHGE